MTKLEQAAASAQAERAQLLQAFDQAPGFVAMSEGPEHRFTFANATYRALIGGREVVGKTVREALPELASQGFYELLDQVYRSGEVFHGTSIPAQIVRKDGGPPEERIFDFVYQPVTDVEGRVIGIFVQGVDVTERHTAESRVAEVQRRLDAVLTNASVAIFLMDERQHCAYMNRAAEDLTGYTFAETQGRSLHDVIHHTHPDGRHFPIEDCIIDRAFPENANTRGEEFFVHKDGSFYPVAYVASPIRDHASRTVGTIIEVRDISTEKAAQRELEAAQRKAEAETTERSAILAQLAEGVIVTDDAGRITFVNDAATQIHGVADLQVPPDAYAARYNLFKETGESYPFEELPLARAVLRDEVVTNERWAIRRPDGTRVVAVGSARPLRGPEGTKLGAVLTLRDETARVTAEAALHDLNETLESRVKTTLAERNLLATLVETTDAFIQAFDHNYRFLAINKAAADECERIYGFRPTVGDTLPELLADRPQDLAAARELWDRALSGEQFTVTEAFGDPSRDRPFYEAKFSGLRNDQGELIGAYQFVYDVTARMNDQERLRQAEEQLRQSQKMEAVGQLTGGIAHDFNNLLQGITGSLHVVQKRIAQGRTGDLDRFVTGAITSANRAAALTHRLLAFSRRQPLDPKPLDANPLVASMEDLLRRTLGETIELELRLADDLWATLCDANQLENAVLNLVINARDAMPDGGKLTIETVNANLKGATVDAENNIKRGDYICISVIDEGMGMSREVINRAFDPFFTTKPIGEGTGLGLSMIYGFARQSEGLAQIDSELGRGTTVRLYLPRHLGSVAQEVVAPRDETQGSQKGEVVVVVEDDTVVRGLIVETLNELGYYVLEAHDGPSGVALLEATQRVDLLITDIGLPGLNGRHVAEAARSRHVEVKVLFITGYAEDAVSSDGFLESGMSMLTKPFEMHALALRVHEHLHA